MAMKSEHRDNHQLNDSALLVQVTQSSFVGFRVDRRALRVALADHMLKMEGNFTYCDQR